MKKFSFGLFVVILIIAYAITMTVVFIRGIGVIPPFIFIIPPIFIAGSIYAGVLRSYVEEGEMIFSFKNILGGIQNVSSGWIYVLYHYLYEK